MPRQRQRQGQEQWSGKEKEKEKRIVQEIENADSESCSRARQFKLSDVLIMRPNLNSATCDKCQRVTHVSFIPSFLDRCSHGFAWLEDDEWNSDAQYYRSGQPSFVRLYRHPNYNTPLANKSFYNADSVSLFWNPTGEHLLVLTATDTSSESYYGDQGLQYLGVNGQSNSIPLGKNGPVYHVEWSPKDAEFCVVYGFMPAKASLYNAKCEPIFHFGTGPWNAAHYNPHGNVLCLCGFGNLRGRMDLWDVRKRKQVSTCTAADTTQFLWCPDGEHIITATTTPRLRVGNGYKIWHYTGSLMYEEHAANGQELWEVSFQPGKYAERPIQYSAVQSTFSTPTPPVMATLAESIPSVYRPPGARGLSTPTAIHTYEKPTDLSKPDTANANLSKAALKNKKKREAKQRARQEQDGEPREPQSPPPTFTAPPSNAQPSNANTEQMKKIKNIEKKLQQIDKLKLQQKEGKQLEVNQLEKIKTEKSLLDELAQLKL